MRNTRAFINASEVGDYVFCAHAWRLRAEGCESTASKAVLDAGINWHYRHGKTVTRSRKLRTATSIFTMLAVLLALLLVIYLVFK